MASKILLSALIVNLVAMIAGDGSLKVGTFSDKSKSLYHGNFDAMGILFFKRTETFDIEITDGKIRGIDIQDLRGDSSSWIMAGGVDENFATIKLESKRGSGYNFIIDIYGDEEDTLDGNNDEEQKEEPPKEDEEGKNESEDKEKEDNSDSSKPKENSGEEIEKEKSEEEKDAGDSRNKYD